jgi:hypothetical protein
MPCSTCNGSHTVPGDVCPHLGFNEEADTLLCRLPDGSWDWSPHGSREDRLARLAHLRSERGEDPRPPALSPGLMEAIAYERHGSRPKQAVICPKCCTTCCITPVTTSDNRLQLRADCPTHGYVKFVAQE